jgi:hypothetical protein
MEPDSRSTGSIEPGSGFILDSARATLNHQQRSQDEIQKHLPNIIAIQNAASDLSDISCFAALHVKAVIHSLSAGRWQQDARP